MLFSYSRKVVCIRCKDIKDNGTVNISLKKAETREPVDMKRLVAIATRFFTNLFLSTNVLLLKAVRIPLIICRCPVTSHRPTVLPLITSRTVQVINANRMPPGILTNAGVWMKNQKLRITLSNTTDK